MPRNRGEDARPYLRTALETDLSVPLRISASLRLNDHSGNLRQLPGRAIAASHQLGRVGVADNHLVG